MSSNFIPTNEGIYQTPISIFNTSEATSTSASLMLNGGLTIFNSQNSLDFNSGGALLILGGSAIKGNAIIGGVMQILDTTQAVDINSGAFQVSGGLSVKKNIYADYGNFNFLQTNTSTTIPNLLSTNISTGSLNTSNITCQNIYATGTMTATNQLSTSITTSNLIVQTSITSPNATIINQTTTNLLATNISTSSLLIPSVTIANTVFTNNSITNSIITNLSVSTLNVTNSIIANNTVINLIVSNQTNTNLLATNINITNLTSTNSILTNITSTNLIVTNVTNTNILSSNISSSNITTINLISTTSGNIAGIGFNYYTGTSGSWINIPVAANSLSGIGNGGIGVNPWVAYAGAPGYWFSNSTTADLCYRNLNGGLLFGNNNTSSSTLKIFNNIINVNSTIESSSTTTGSLVIAGGVGISKNVIIGSTTPATNNSTGGLIMSNCGIGVDGTVYADYFYTYLGGTTLPTVPLTPSPLTTQGDIYTWNTNNDRLPAGTYAQTLISNTTASTGLSWVNPLIQDGFYGSDYHFIEAFATTGTTSTIGTLKISLTTGTLFGGIYKIEINYHIAPNTSTTQDIQTGVYLNTNSTSGFSVGTTTTNMLHDQIIRYSRSTFSTPICSTVVKTFAANSINTIGLFFRPLQNGQTCNVGRSNLLLYRIQ